jgi:hypothetical protein
MAFTYIQQFRTGEHTFLHARVEKVDVIAQQLVDRDHFRQFRLESAPVRFQHLLGDKRQYLLYPREHPRAQHEQTETPSGKVGRYVRASPHWALLLEPHRGKRLLDVLEVKKEAKQKLVAKNRLARNYERERELDVEIELESIDGCGCDEPASVPRGGDARD